MEEWVAGEVKVEPKCGRKLSILRLVVIWRIKQVKKSIV